MAITDVMQAISTVGFPICAFFVAVLGIRYAFDRSQETNEKAFEKLSALTDAVNSNTAVLANLVEKIGDIKNDK